MPTMMPLATLDPIGSTVSVLGTTLGPLAASVLVDVSFGARPADFPIVRLVSYTGVTAVGGFLLWHALRRDHAPATFQPTAREGPLPYFAGLAPCPLTTIIMVVALANGMIVLGLLVSLSMALGMIVTVTLFALTVILSRRRLLEFLARHAVRVDGVARALEIAGAAAVTAVGLLLLSAELA